MWWGKQWEAAPVSGVPSEGKRQRAATRRVLVDGSSGSGGSGSGLPNGQSRSGGIGIECKAQQPQAESRRAEDDGPAGPVEKIYQREPVA